YNGAERARLGLWHGRQDRRRREDRTLHRRDMNFEHRTTLLAPSWLAIDREKARWKKNFRRRKLDGCVDVGINHYPSYNVTYVNVGTFAAAGPDLHIILGFIYIKIKPLLLAGQEGVQEDVTRPPSRPRSLIQSMEQAVIKDCVV
ncbi:hypothetical protein U1Q18_049075, partial [Sarracenia purpurea var. burkii]